MRDHEAGRNKWRTSPGPGPSSAWARGIGVDGERAAS